MAGLDAYKRKRDPKQTPEPFGGARRAAASPIFVIQRHDARRLHYDFRLERNGALASWAVPKGVPLEPGERVLAVHVEDHPLDYASFAGEIPEGQYGAGTVEIWDRGTYELVEEKRDGGLTVRLDGERLHGVWTLVPGAPRRQGAELAADPKARRARSPQRRAGARYRPMLATPAERAARRGEGWLFEVKWDGYRALAYVRGGDVPAALAERQRPHGAFRAGRKAIDQGGADAERRARRRGVRAGRGGPPELLGECRAGRAARLLRVRRARGRRRAARRPAAAWSARRGCEPARPAERDGPALGGVRRRRGAARGRDERRGSRASWPSGRTRVPPGSPHARLAQGQDARPPGVRGRRLHARRGPACVEHRRARAGRERGRLAALGRQRRLRVRRRRDRAAAGAAAPARARRPRRSRSRRRCRASARATSSWVEPRLVAEVAFGEWTRDGRLRHPRYIGLRDDKPAREVRRERPVEEVVRRGKRELRLTNLDKVFWPDEGITKGDLVDYYRQVAPVLVPHLRNRPFTMRRYPDGIDGKAFFQKDAPVAHARLDPDLPRARLAARREGEARGRVPARERRARAALDGEHGLHRHEPVVLAGRPPRPAGLRALRPRPDAGGAVVADDPGRAARARGCSSWSASSRSRRRRAARASTCSCRSTAARPTRTRARSRSSSRRRSCARIPTSRRGSGRRRAAAAC